MFSMFASYPSVALEDLRPSYDYIIIGGGTAGCVLANRLSQDPSITVLLIERGGLRNGWTSTVPLFSSHFASDGRSSKVWKSTSQSHLGDRRVDLVGGNSLGGASKINAMLQTQGLPAEFNSWQQNWSAEGWEYERIQPYFFKSPGRPRSHQHLHWQHSEHVIKATSSLGLPYVDDPNSSFQPSHGCAKMHYNIESSGRRSSTLSTYLPMKLVKSRSSRLHVCLEILVHRIEMDGLEARGVWLQKTDGSGISHLIIATKEIVLSAGPIGSPHILLLSGIGPEKHLQTQKIPVVKNLPGVGSNLQDHLSVPVQFCVPLLDSLAKIELRPWLIIKEILLYLLFGVGLLLSPVLELSIFVQSRLLDETMRISSYSESDLDSTIPMNRPDIELMPISWGNVKKHRQGGLTFFTVTLRPTSLGTVRLASNDPFVPPEIDPKYYSTEQDRSVMRKGVRFAIRLKEQMSAQGYLITNSEDHLPRSQSDDDIDEFVRTECQSTNHYSSTCRMAPEHLQGVVDSSLRVHGVKRLRIADSSIFPEILSTHLAAATVMVAEKCANMILEDRERNEETVLG